MFTPYCYKQLVVKCDYVLQQVQTLSCWNSLNNNFFSPITSIYLLFSLQHYLLPFHPLTTMTHFTSNYYYTLKIAGVCCIFACSYSLSHLFSFTIITHVGGSNGVNTGPMKHWLPFLNNTNPI